MVVQIETSAILPVMPVSIIGTEADGQLNFAPHGQIGTVTAEPPVIYTSVIHEHQTARNILKTRRFSVNIPSADLLEKVRISGNLSGADADKSSLFETFDADGVPMIQDCAISFACEVIQHIEMGVPNLAQKIGEEAEDVQPILHKIRAVIRESAPDAVENISWQMPTFWQGENLIHFAAFKKHIGIYPGDLSRAPFAEKLTGYNHTKGAIQFPLDQPIDYEFIAEITRFRVAAIVGKGKHRCAAKEQSQ